MIQYEFSNSGIDLACEEIEKFLAQSDVERREVLRIRLTFEEILLEYQAKLGEQAAFKVRCVRRFPSIRVELIVAGESFDPFANRSEEDTVIRGLLAGAGLAPVWSYKSGKNYVVIIPKKKPLSSTVKMLLAIVVAIFAGTGLNLLPDSVAAGANAYVLTPVTDMFMGLVSAVSGPLIFLLVLGSICSMGNMETFGRIGSKTIRSIFLESMIFALLMTAVGCQFYRVEWSAGGGAGFSLVLDLVYDIVPANLFEPFVTGNALQLIFISVMIGLAMLVLASKVGIIFTIVEQLSSIMQMVMSGLTSMLPASIFVIFTGMISNGNLSVLMSMWKMMAVTALLIAVYSAANFLRTAFINRISPALLFKKVWPTALAALATASSSAAFATNIRDSKKKLGIDKKLVDFGIPLGQVLFKPGYFAVFLGMEAGLAQAYGIAMTVPWLITALITNILITFATPPIPGGAMMCFAIAFAQLGIPVEAMGIAVAANAILDFPATACSVSCWQLRMIDVADSLEMLNEETLHKNES